MHYYKFNIGDYASHTQHLDPIEDIVYRRMIDWCYLNESPLPNDTEEIARLIRMRTHSESIANVLREFFYLDEDGYKQGRIEKELSGYREKSDKAKASANARWLKEKGKQDNANAMRPECERNAKHKPLTTNHKPDNSIMSGKPNDAHKKINGYKSQAIEVLDFLNNRIGRKYKPVDANLNMIIARLKEGYELREFRQVIAKKCREWEFDEKMSPYLRPATLFNKTNFAQYTGELVAPENSNA